MSPRVHFASWVWILFGSFGLIIQMKAFGVALTRTSPFFVLFAVSIPGGLYLFWCGRQATSRLMRDILIPSSVSITLGFLYQTFAASLIVAFAFTPGTSAMIDEMQQFRYETVYVYSVEGAILLLAGFLALTQRKQFREWSNERSSAALEY